MLGKSILGAAVLGSPALFFVTSGILSETEGGCNPRIRPPGYLDALGPAGISPECRT